MQTTDRPELRRLFPTAYPDDPDRDAGYQVFARDLELIEKRRAAVEVIRSTAEADVLTAEELGAWMGVLNDLRLVLGTMLDVSEDDHHIDVDNPDAEAHVLYQWLGELVHVMVEALTNHRDPARAGHPPRRVRRCRRLTRGRNRVWRAPQPARLIQPSCGSIQVE